MDQNKRYEILYRLQNESFSSTTELTYRSPFELLIAVMLSAQTTDKKVNSVTGPLFSLANSPHSMLELGLESIKKYIKPIGMFNKKAGNIIKICQILLEKYSGEVPQDPAALEALPGIGRKTANVVLNVAFSWPTIAVDRHVFRVANRTNFAIGKTVEAVERKMLIFVPNEFKISCHHWFVLHGRYTCRAYKPRCDSCLIEDLCEYNQKNNKKDEF
ncbi:endonuclease III [Sodalis sp. CWE]|uniref:endonuclease III n=1 Tax=Sodalis sp. CWE TaxID=2803816 RepID=UPI001C7D9E10|nr:endonuclease III [Sodalis sp. CWE]MBX4181149.1 endonuclease III [Sodalis sp. CWE]